MTPAPRMPAMPSPSARATGDAMPAVRPRQAPSDEPQVFSWRPPGAPVVRGLDMGTFAPAIWHNAINGACRDATAWLAPNVISESLTLPPPRALALRITEPQISVRGFAFQPVEVPAAPGPSPPSEENGHASHESAAGRRATQSGTRIRPPADIVKLEDRLQYLLQPPLESLLTERALHFPFQPFPYQFEGVAFLYPRHAAILADEMGLGKTMQAITAIRLLLRCGEARSVLLICPKPLVSNWQREFAQWA
ncbi:MAG: SNF2-related protein, partial [Patescibacteria group bacterium]|nr:SNF2-related protein [Patescibacteria group bacterium]